MKTVAIVQARMSSTRLPGKVLEPVAGRPLLWHTVSRARGASGIDEVVLATSVESSDDPIAGYAAREGIAVWRGSLEDVLDRFRGAARAHAAERVVRLTADCPLLDPQVVTEVVRAFEPRRHDYVSNTLERSYPDGLDTEVISTAALERAWREARLPSERQHVTPYIWKHPERFRLRSVRQPVDRSRERWTVDEPRDLDFVRAVFDALGRTRFGQAEVLELLERRPELRRLNRGIATNEGYLRSLEGDAGFRGDREGQGQDDG